MNPVRVEEVMTHRVRTAAPDAPLPEIWQALLDERCHHLPIVEDGRPVGIISTRDLIRLAREHDAKNAKKLTARLRGATETASDIMTRELQTIRVDEPVEVAIDRIGPGEIHALLVVDDRGRLAGIVTNHDLLAYLIG